ncbi:hypothetical protein KP509_09G078600 [Ceratopteris richardii]|uniref:non-specific serine/threonine protein kinase n=1 Tax=Ceratopteris richardii TaxID=49495 RepID=A0A8T2UC15_CERRI|nr:hypothetical protein KP509_09G078600 [Ceratopteris richardii]KAH7430019.1 hypothetical protein KP509_09G078600 [Ceratopteris richardii]
MGCFGCFGSKGKDKKKVEDPKGACNVSYSDTSNGVKDHYPYHTKVAAAADVSKEPTKDLSVSVPTTDPLEQDLSALNTRAQTFTFKELAAAANNFRADCLIGEGGFGPVYKGQLENGQVVAIKQLDRDGVQGNREFLVEVLMLSLLHHDNLVNLIGYCADGDQRLLVYEFMPLGSLEDHLHDLPPDRQPLDWTTRMRIAAGAAKGLEYLHDKANPPVIYRDLKSSNILLGENYFPKLSDFGLAKLGPVGDKTHVSTRVMGTYGYCAPEYAMTGQLTLKSDVYSFGVVLLELITGRKAIDQTKRTGEHNLVAWARPLFKDRKKFGQMADPKLQGHFPVRGLFQALAVAAMCLHEQAASRPLIADVVTALNFLASQTCDPVPRISRASSIASPEHPKLGQSNKAYRQQLVAESGKPVESPEESTPDERTDAENGKPSCSQRNGLRASTWRAPMEGKEREQAIAEARVWGEAWREKRGGSRRERADE